MAGEKDRMGREEAGRGGKGRMGRGVFVGMRSGPE